MRRYVLCHFGGHRVYFPNAARTRGEMPRRLPVRCERAGCPGADRHRPLSKLDFYSPREVRAERGIDGTLPSALALAAVGAVLLGIAGAAVGLMAGAASGVSVRRAMRRDVELFNKS
ncbi:MAG: hypothetical protein ACT4PT_06500 [Methanobacteriota archaeon]